MGIEKPQKLRPEQLEKIRKTMQDEMRERTGSPYTTLTAKEAEQRLEKEKIEANLEAQEAMKKHPEIFG